MLTIRNTKGLEALVVGPYCWTPLNSYHFISESYNVIMKEVDRLRYIEEIEKHMIVAQNIIDNGKREIKIRELETVKAELRLGDQSEIAQFVKQLTEESWQVLGEENWVDMIGIELWNILKLDEKGKDRFKVNDVVIMTTVLKSRSIVYLTKLIRDKIAHMRTYNDDIKEKLVQFFDVDDKGRYNFNQNKYMVFWISKFPLLIPYLWIQYYKFKKTLKHYYPKYEIEINKLRNPLLNLNMFEEELRRALNFDMESGNILKRFKGPGFSLEFRGFPNIAKTLVKSLPITVLVNPQDKISICVSHSSPNDSTLEYAGTDQGAEKIIIIFTEKITDADVWKYCTNCDCRIIIFADPDNLSDKLFKKAVGKFERKINSAFKLSEFPITASELSTEKQSWIFEQGLVCIQGWDMKIKDIILDRNDMLGVLSGEVLNKVLRQEKVSICANYNFPEYKGVYIERKIYCSDSNLNGRYEGELLESVTSQNIKAICLLGKSGIGKSKFLINLGKKMKNSLVIFITFRYFVNCIQKIVGTEKCSKNAIKTVILQILKCRNECERRLIYQWIEQKWHNGARINLQLDGLDEVPRRQLVLAFEALKVVQRDFDTVNLWITSSKEFLSERDGFECTDCNIYPFSRNDKINFIIQTCRMQYSELSEVTLYKYGKQLEEKLFFDEEFSDFIGYPLNCSMLVELYGDDLTKLLDDISVPFDLYEALVRKKFSVMLKEKRGVGTYDDEDYEIEQEIYLQAYTHLALVHIFPTVSHRFKRPTSLQYLKPESYPKMGIITNREPLTFIHFTYAEFLVARYILKVLKTGNLEQLCPKELFYNFLKFATIDENEQNVSFPIWRFVDEGLGKLSDWSSLKLKWLNIHKSDLNNLSAFLSDSINLETLWNVSRLLINLWVDETDTNMCNKILYLSLVNEAPSNWFISVSELLAFDNQHDLLMYSVVNGNYEIAKYLIENKCGNDVFDRIAKMSKSGGGILHFIIYRIALRFVEIIPKIFVENTTALLRFVYAKSPKEIERRDSRGRNLLQALPLIQKDRQSLISSKRIFAIKEVLINELNADVNKLFDGESILSLERDLDYISQHEAIDLPRTCFYVAGSDNFDFRNVEGYYATLALLATKNFAHINLRSKASGLTPLLEAVKFFGSKLGERSLQIFRDLGANFNELDGSGDTILHYFIKKWDEIEFVKLLVKYGSKISVQNGENLCAMCVAEKERKVKIKNYFQEKLGLNGEQTCELNCTKIMEHE